MRERVHELLGALPAVDPRALHALGDSLDRADRDAARRLRRHGARVAVGELRREPQELGRLAPLAEVWEPAQPRRDATSTTYNLDRKPLVFAVFGWLAEAARG